MATLPPVLYWSPSLAEQLNERLGEDVRHGLIDFTDAEWPRHWIGDGEFWCGTDGLPGDAVRLVADITPPAEVRTEWGVRRADGVVSAPAKNAEQVNRLLAERDGEQLVSRQVRTGAWAVAS